LLLLSGGEDMKLQLVERRNEVEDVETFIFEPEQPIAWQAGQFLHYVLEHPNADDRGSERWFTISTAPYEIRPSITTRFTNPNGSTFKQALKSMKIGDFIDGDTPEGDFVIDESAKKLVLIAGGIGITPYRAMLLQLAHDSQQINADLLYANRDNSFVFEELFANLEQKQPGFKMSKFIGDNYIKEEDFKKYLGEDGVVFYVSGPKAMVDTYTQTLKGLDVTERQIKTDYFPGYGTYLPA
jgi:ferredoxin-NADP reductase